MVLKVIHESDLVGAIASGLCLVHCLATPFIFIAQSCSLSGCCTSSPAWWSSIDYIFVAITFFAVLQSGKNTNKSWLKIAMYSSWVLLTLLIFNGQLDILQLSPLWKHSVAISLIALHLYNLKFCGCAEKSCCASSVI